MWALVRGALNGSASRGPDDAIETGADLGPVIACSVMLAVLDAFNTSHPDDYDLTRESDSPQHDGNDALIVGVTESEMAVCLAGRYLQVDRGNITIRVNSRGHSDGDRRESPNKRINASRNRPVGSLRSVTLTPGRVILVVSRQRPTTS